MRRLQALIMLVLSTLALTYSVLPPGDKIDRVRAYTRAIEFDYATWMLQALEVKAGEWALGTLRYLPEPDQRQMALEFLRLTTDIAVNEWRLSEVFSDPNVTDPQAASAALRQELEGMYARRDQLAPVAEAVLQSQVTEVLGDFGLTVGGQPVPPVLYHSTPLPLALIVSPREVIRQDADISLLPDLTTAERAALEDRVDQGLNVSSLVVNVGGVGVYPTMVMQTSDLNWLSEVVAHEWIHNYLTLRPLGMSYLSTPELRIMNETAAAIAGKEIGRVVIEQFYPELVPPPPAEPAEPSQPTEPAEPAEPVFSFQAAMHETRVTVDQMLADGQIEAAEEYMEKRRIYLYENGYHLRKLNQAYFAFYGAYADQPGGAAGEDPVGAAVRALRAQSTTLAEFINRISWMASFAELQEAVAENGALTTLDHAASN